MRIIDDCAYSTDVDQMTRWLFHVLQTTDTMYPTGSYAHSFALEGLVQDGTVSDEATLRDYLTHGFFAAVAGGEVPVAHAAWKAAGSGDIERLLELDELANAMRPTMELREASRRTGLQRLRTAMEMKAHPLLQDFVDRGAGCHGAVVFGMECALWGVPARPAMRAFVYQALAGQIAAAFKLIPIGQMTAQRILCDLTADIEFELDSAMKIPPEEAGWFTPLADIASARHERAYSRLFIS